MPLALLALALGGFGIGLTEFVIAGLLPEVAADFAVDEATAGWLISGYALSVAAGAVLITAATTRLPRKPVLLGLLVLFIGGNLLSALATSYEMLLTGRILAALCHGAFFGIGAVVAGSLVDPSRKAGAIALMFTGLTVANVLGVPFGTFLGQAFGWRSTFAAITAIGVLAFVGVLALVPSPPHDEHASLARELTGFRSAQVWLSLLMTVLGFGGMFGAFSYIAYTLTEVSGFPTATVPWLLIVFGAGLFLGNLVGGRLADRSTDRALLVALLGSTIVLGAFALVAANPVLTIAALVLMGAFGMAASPALQSRVMQHAAHAPTLASAANIAAFNLGNSFGAWVGGLAITAGLGYTAPLWSGSAISAGALVVLGIATLLLRARRARPVAAPTGREARPTSATPVTCSTPTV